MSATESNTMLSNAESRRLNHLRALMLQTIDKAWASVPVQNAPSSFHKDIRESHAEIIHEYTAQTFVNVRQNILVRTPF